MSFARGSLSLLICLLSSASLRADELPPRAIARLGDYRFYHGSDISCAALSPDGRWAASGGGSRIVVWDTATGKPFHELTVAQQAAFLAFSPDGTRIAAGCGSASRGLEDGTCFIVVFDVRTGKRIWQSPQPGGDLRCLSFSTDGSQLHTSFRWGPVTAWDAATGRELRVWKPPEGPPLRAGDHTLTGQCVDGALSPDGKVIVWFVGSGVEEKLSYYYVVRELRVHDARTERLLYRKTAAAGSFDRFAFSSDGHRFAFVDGPRAPWDALVVHGRLTVWDTASGNEVGYLMHTPRDVSAVTLSADASAAAFGDFTGRVAVWDLRAVKKRRDVGVLCGRLGGFGSTWLSLSADGKTLLIPGDKTLHVWDVEAGKERGDWPGHGDDVTGLSFSADGRTLYSRSDAAACCWDVSTGKQTDRFRLDMTRACEYSADSRLSLAQVGSPARFRGRRITDERRENLLQLRETQTGRLLQEFRDTRGDVRLLRFSERGDKALLWDAEGYLVYDVRGRRPLWRPDLSFRTLRGEIEFSPDGTLLVWSGSEQVVHVHDATTGVAIRTLSPAGRTARTSHPSRGLLFSPDNTYLARIPQARFDERPEPIRIYHVPTGLEIASFFLHPEDNGNSDDPVGVALSPDGRVLAVTEGQTTRIRLIEVASGKDRLTLDGHRDLVTTLAFSPDSRTLASGGKDNLIYLWDVAGEDTARAMSPDDEKLSACWDDLAANDATRAGTAVRSLASAPASVAFLTKRLPPVKRADQKHLARLIRDLDADAFDQRESASRDLAALGERAEGALREALGKRPSLETRRRIDELLQPLDAWPPSPEALRIIRAVEALEHIGTSEARKLLQALADGDPNARLTRDAKESLKRLERQ
jgi:WD40 repeat protein